MRVNKFDLIKNDDGIATLVKESSVNYSAEYDKFDSIDKVVDFAKNHLHMDKMAEERVYLLCLAANGKLKGYSEISHGGSNTSIFPIQSVARKALLMDAQNCIILHNHPSGDPTPSKADDESTKKLKSAFDILEINLLDHIIIGDTCYSYLESKGSLGALHVPLKILPT